VTAETTTRTRHATIYRLVTPDHVCPYGLKSLDLLKRHGFDIDDRHLETEDQAADYADAHLPGAINIPLAQVERLAPRLLPDQSVPVVVYCSGSCSSADDVARRLEAAGYTNVAVYVGGKEDWVEHGLPVERSDVRDST